MVALFNAIRATRLAYLQKKHPTLRDSDVRRLAQMNCENERVKLQLLDHLTAPPVCLYTVNTSDNETLPEGGLHGENWPNGLNLLLDLFTFDIFYRCN